MHLLTVLAVWEALTAMFDDCWIGRFGPRRWPPRSPDLTPLDFFLWSGLKDEVYARESSTDEEMKEKIIAAFHKLRVSSSERTVENSIKTRCEMCIRVDGRHVENRLL